uniref:Major facilitator superfamily (MFS) profile domain-containing protein n=1 Tax=Plectus sambesii TaxID=2011161 RepID=A0A914W6G8_9BILA
MNSDDQTSDISVDIKAISVERIDTSDIPSRAWFWRLGALVTVICLCSQFQIYHTAVINNVFDKAKPWLLEQYGNESDVVDTQWTIMTSAVPLGQFVGTLTSGMVADTFGRKGAYIGVSVVLTASGVMMGLCRVTGIFLLVIIGRFLLGLVVGIAINVAILFITEAAPKKNRGSFSAVTQWFYSLGDLLALGISLPQVLGTETLWPLAMAIGCLPAPFLLPALIFCPESPRYLYLNKSREKNCREAIRFYQGEDNIDETEKDLLEERLAIESAPRVGLIALFRNRMHLRSVLMACLVTASCQLTGISAIIAYSTTIIQKAGLDHTSAAWATFGVGVFKLVSGFVPPSLMDTWGRRPMNQIGLIGCCLCHIALILAIWLLPPSTYLGVGVSVVLALYMAAYTCQSCAMCAYSGELFVQSARATGLVVANSFAWLMATVVSFSFLPLVASCGVPVALLPYAIGSAASAVVGYFVLLETKGLTFREIAVGLNSTKAQQVWTEPKTVKH